jgi:hypothetical protein
MNKTPLKITALVVSVSLVSVLIAYRSGYFDKNKNSVIVDNSLINVKDTIPRNDTIANRERLFQIKKFQDSILAQIKKPTYITSTKSGAMFPIQVPQSDLSAYFIVPDSLIKKTDTTREADKAAKKDSVTLVTPAFFSKKFDSLYSENSVERRYRDYMYSSKSMTVLSFEDFKKNDSIAVKKNIDTGYIKAFTTSAPPPRFSGSKSAVIIQRREIERPKPKKIEIPNFFRHN